MPAKNKLNAKQADTLLTILQTRFEKHPQRHKGIEWKDVEKRLKKASVKLCIVTGKQIGRAHV